MFQSGAATGGQGKPGKTEAELLAGILQELAKQDDVGEMGKGGAIAQAFLQAYFEPQSEQDRAVQSLLKMEMAERSGMVPQERRKDFVRMREFLEVQAGVRSPDEVDNDVFDSDKGFGYVTYGDKAHFIGDDGPDGKPREYVTGSPEFKERLKKMEEQRKRHDGVLSEPGRIMQRYQDVYDQHERAKQQAQRAQKEKGTERGWYPDMPWSPQDAQKMHEQGFGQPSARKAKEEDLWKAQETAMARGVQPGSGGAADSRPLGQPYDPAQGPPSVGDVARHTSESARQAGRKAGEKAGQMRDQGGVGGWLTSKLTEHIGKQFGWDLSKENRR